MEAFLRHAAHSYGRAFNYLWSMGMAIGPAGALVLLGDDPGSTSSRTHGDQPRDCDRWGARGLQCVEDADLQHDPGLGPEAMPTDWAVDSSFHGSASSSSW